MNLVVAFACLGCLACTEHVQLVDEGTLPGLVALEVTPADTRLAIDGLDAPAQVQPYAALGRFVDGTTRDVTALVEWRVDNAAPGAIDVAGTFTTSNAAAGHVRVIAQSGDVVDDAALVVTVRATIRDPLAPPPADLAPLFGPSVSVVPAPATGPAVRYPSHETLFPQGLAPALFQHVLGSDHDVIRLAFQSDVLALDVYTTADRWQPDARAWSLVARSHPGGEVALVVDAAATARPGTLSRAPTTTLRFARGAADGALYYFSEGTSGVLRASLAAASPTPILPAGGDDRCIGCHAISRDGATMVFGHGGETLATFDLATGEPGLTTTANIGMGWATFSPDGSQLLVADRGTLELRDAATGASRGRVPLPMGVRASHPDWSPDGTQIAVTLAGTINNMELRGGSIGRIPYAGGAWGAPVVLVASTSDSDNNYFPKWSPDGRYLAYIHADEPSRDAISAELRLIGAAGGTPVALATASHRVGRVEVPYLASTMPTWIPAAADDGLAWLAFASRRPYGILRSVNGASQIWVAAIDVRRTGDPSFAAFRLEAQDLGTLANGPIWAPLPAPPE